MADTTPEDTQDVTEDTDQQDTGATPETFDADYVKKLRAENAKYRTEAKANADAAKRLAELEDAKKSDEQRNAERIAALEGELKAERIGRARAQVGAAKGLPASLVSLLRGETIEEMEEHADELLSDLQDKYVPKSTADPKDTGAGVKGDAHDDDGDPMALAQAALGSRRR